MKRKLIIMRHAKSSWKTGDQDHQRPLNARGAKDAPRIAGALVSRRWVPELVLSSDSMRTRQTWENMAPVFGRDISVEYRPELYLAGLVQIASALETVASEVSTVLVLGHNPGWESSVCALTGHSIQMTTANAVLLTTEAESWASAIHGPTWQYEEVLRPRPPQTPIPR